MINRSQIINRKHMINIILLLIFILIVLPCLIGHYSINENFSTKNYKFIKINMDKKNNKKYRITTYDNNKLFVLINNNNNNLHEYMCTLDDISIKFNYMLNSILKFKLNNYIVEIEHRNKTKFIKISINENNEDFDTVFYFYKDMSDNNKLNYFIANQNDEIGYIEYNTNQYIIITDAEYYKYINMLAIAFIFYINDQV